MGHDFFRGSLKHHLLERDWSLNLHRRHQIPLDNFANAVRIAQMIGNFRFYVISPNFV